MNNYRNRNKLVSCRTTCLCFFRIINDVKLKAYRLADGNCRVTSQVNPSESIGRHLKVLDRLVYEHISSLKAESSREMPPGVKVAARAPSEAGIILCDNYLNGGVFKCFQP